MDDRPSGNKSFNPRAHERRDLGLGNYNKSTLFQSTRPREARPNRMGTEGVTNLFQSTRPREARRVGFNSTNVMMFQSTRPREARHLKQQRLMAHNVSIHAPTRGATTLVHI